MTHLHTQFEIFIPQKEKLPLSRDVPSGWDGRYLLLYHGQLAIVLPRPGRRSTRRADQGS